MNRKHILLAVILGIVILVIAGVAAILWQQNQLNEIYTPNLQPMTEVQQQAEEEPSQEMDPVTQEMEETQSDILEATTPAEEQPSNGAVETKPSELEPEQTEEEIAEQAVADAIEQLQTVQDSYVAALDQLVAETKAEYSALPAEEKNTDTKMALVNSKFDEISSMEKACDAEVENLLLVIAKAQMVLGNYDLVNEIRSYYTESKATWKADCLTALATS